MSFGRKGLSAGAASAPAAQGGFGRAGAAAPAFAQSPAQAAQDEEMAARREAFIASERARRAQEEGGSLEGPHQISQPAQPATRLAEVGAGPVGPNGLSQAQEEQIRASMRGHSAGRPAARKEFLFGDPRSRSLGLAYVLWFILGQASLHRFYCGQKDSAIFQICLFVGSLVILFIFPPLGAVGVVAWMFWIIADLFLMPGMMRRFKAAHDQTGVFE